LALKIFHSTPIAFNQLTYMLQCLVSDRLVYPYVEREVKPHNIVRFTYQY